MSSSQHSAGTDCFLYLFLIMDERKRDVEYRVSPNISSVTGSGGQSRGVKRAQDKRERLESMLQNGRRRERFLGSSEEPLI